MGCGASSGITVVEPVKPSSENELDSLQVQRSGGGDRGDSAVSKHTTDSGLGLEAAEGVILPGAVPRQLPPLRATNSLGQAQNSTPTPRQQSSEILEQLLSQGIIPAQTRTASSGEAYSIMMDEAEKPKRRPPPRLEKLMVRKEQGTATKEDIEEKMRQAEERRQMKEDELKVRLRTKSARPRQAVSQAGAEGHTVVEELRLEPPAASLLDPPKTPDRQNRISPLPGRSESGREGGEEGGRDGVTVGDKDGGRRDAPLTDSLNMESDSTFQQVEDIEEIF